MLVRMPLLFIGHGNPMNAILDNEYSRGWEQVGAGLPKPKAIVCMSAHWLTRGSYITSTARPEVIYDFYGFPEELYQVAYPAAGEPELATEIHRLLSEIEPDGQRGLDHGAWTVLKHLFPNADVPVLQLSIDYARPPEEQFRLLQGLRSLREKGILFIGSGNIVHNLQMWRPNSKPFGWAVEFETFCKTQIATGDFEPLIHYEKIGHAAALSIPTDDHYRPMLNTLALTTEGEVPAFFNEGIDGASLSMLSFVYR
jgi:4,5-DOPA dioxygenase extradiol